METSTSKPTTFQRPVPMRSTDHQVIERVDAPRHDDRVMARYFCRGCGRQANDLADFASERCPDA